LYSLSQQYHTTKREDELEQTLQVVRECYVYKIPPRFVSAGHKAADWDLSAPLWTGRLTVTSKGDRCVVKLEDPSTGELFAQCPVSDASIEPVTDSSRYFVLKIDDGTGRHAFVGMGFAERSEAFDFSSALQDHKKYVKQRKEEKESVNKISNAPKVDYSLPEGAKIHVNIKVPSVKKPSNSSPTMGGGLGFLPPPPGSSQAKKVTPPSTSNQYPTSFFQSPMSMPAQQTNPQQTNSQSSQNDLFDFTDFTGPSSNFPAPQQQQQQQQKNLDWVNF